MVFAPTFLCSKYVQTHAAVFGKFESVREKILQHLLQAFRVSDHAARETRIRLYLEIKPATFSFVPERTRDHVEQTGEEDFFSLYRNCSRLDLREVQNIGNQIQQVRSSAVNCAGEFNLLGSQVAVRVVGKLLAKNQNAIERRAQFVRHVGQKLRLILRGKGQLFSFFFHRSTRLFNLLIFAFHFHVLLGQLLGLLSKLFVGLLQFSLLRLEFCG